MKKKYFLILHLLFNNTIFTLKNCFINLIFIFSVILYIYIKYLLFVNYVQLNQKIKKIQIDLIYFFEFKHNLNQNYFMRNFFKQLNYTNFDYVVQLYYNILQFLPSILFILILFILIAYSTLVERKILAAFQR